MPEKNKRRGEKSKNSGDGAAPLLNGHDKVGDGRRRAPYGSKEWGRGVGGSVSVRWHGMVGTSPEPVSAGRQCAPAQNRHCGVAAKWGQATVLATTVKFDLKI
jgi:hypothetical protein